MKKEDVQNVIRQMFQTPVNGNVEINANCKPKDIASLVFALFHKNRLLIRDTIYWLKEMDSDFDKINNVYQFARKR